jgi:hypothetical protein
MSNKAKPLPVDIIRESLELDPTSKTWLRWKKRPSHHFPTDSACNAWNGAWAGKHAGSKFPISKWKVYWGVGLCGKNLYAHRVVWLLANGTDPGQFEIDHIDRDSLNNNPENLRLATHAQNTMNRKATYVNSSGKKGVGWNKRANKWEARIHLNRRKKFLGNFDSIEDAAAAYKKAAVELHGEFALCD